MLLPSCGKREESLDALTRRVFSVAASQARDMDARLGEGETPRTLENDGTLINDGIGWWCSGFYPGSLWYIWQYGQDPEIQALAEKHTARLDTLIRRKTDHDIGFQINCSYGNGLSVHPEYDAYMFQCAEKLAARYDPCPSVIKSWDNPKWEYPVIIDNMMNLELLMEEARRHDDDELKEVAYSHAMTTIQNHFREDYSTFHLVNYSPEDGHVIGRQTVQGYADDSAWARGQAWAIYGYTMVYQYTHEKRYLDWAEKVTDAYLSALPDSTRIPYWDFSRDDFRAASAAAIVASALVNLSELSGKKAYLDEAKTMLENLSKPPYISGKEKPSFIMHSVGNMPAGTEIDYSINYADYYYLEALLRLIEIQEKNAKK